MSGIVELGHTGVWVNDLDKMRDFYTRVLGLVVTDEDPEAGMVFLSSRPDVEHHEFVLARGRVGAPDVIRSREPDSRAAREGTLALKWGGSNGRHFEGVSAPRLIRRSEFRF
jgi:catechol 2,3-dioxygenase-like lactoylglutathione lyase family enzyme